MESKINVGDLIANDIEEEKVMKMTFIPVEAAESF